MSTPFYCDVCEMDSYVSIPGGITTDGFEVTCPECGVNFFFDSVSYEIEEENKLRGASCDYLTIYDD